VTGKIGIFCPPGEKEIHGGIRRSVQVSGPVAEHELRSDSGADHIVADALDAAGNVGIVLGLIAGPGSDPSIAAADLGVGGLIAGRQFGWSG